MVSRSFVAAGAGSLLLALAFPAAAATYYVSPTGAGTSCSLASPCRQIRTALALVSPSDTIMVADGNYLGFDVDDIDGLPGQPITIKAQGSNAVVTITTDRADNRDTIFVTFSDWIVIDGLRSFGANRAAVRVDQSSHVTVQNGVYGNNARWGIFTDFADDLRLENNECYGSVAEHGVYVSNSGDRPIVRGNRLHDNAGAGVQLNADESAGGDGIITGALIENNLIYGNGTLGGAGINLDGVQDSIVRNNLLYGNHATGIVNYHGDGAVGPSGMQILHNTVDQAVDGRWALLIWNSEGPNLVRNNILYNRNTGRGSITYLVAQDVLNTDSDYNVMDKVTPDDDATIYTLAQWQNMGHEPHSVVPGTLANLFVNTATADYHLPAGSPAVDRGLTLPSVTLDIEGHTRPQGASSDAGAYERVVAAPPTISIDDATVTEGNAGTTPAVFVVHLSAASAQTVTAAFTTANGTAMAPGDYTAASGTVTFTPGVVTSTVSVLVQGDTVVEADETFTVTLSAPVNATIADGQATGTISDDDAPPLSGLELSHGSLVWQDLSAATGTAGQDSYRFAQQPNASYEVVLDSASGDVSPAVLQRLAADNSTVLQTALALGTGTARSLRWQNSASTAIVNQPIRVTSGGCTTACGPDDVYRLRAWETTGSVARFNNSGTQISVLVLQNVTSGTVNGRAYFWTLAGTLAGSQAFTLVARAGLVLNTAAVAGVAGQGGSITVSHDGGYGALAGKSVALEPATGFSFDSPMTPRPR
jgi:parallel beta-helix repeat protein